MNLGKEGEDPERRQIQHSVSSSAAAPPSAAATVRHAEVEPSPPQPPSAAAAVAAAPAVVSEQPARQLPTVTIPSRDPDALFSGGGIRYSFFALFMLFLKLCFLLFFVGGVVLVTAECMLWN